MGYQPQRKGCENQVKRDAHSDEILEAIAFKKMFFPRSNTKRHEEKQNHPISPSCFFRVSSWEKHFLESYSNPDYRIFNHLQKVLCKAAHQTALNNQLTMPEHSPLTRVLQTVYTQCDRLGDRRSDSAHARCYCGDHKVNRAPYSHENLE